MDQVACAYGGVLAVDFGSGGEAAIDRVAYRFADSGYTLFVVDSGGSHSDLTADYAAVPDEMKAAAAFFDAEVLRSVDENRFHSAVPELRKRFGDRVILRALHFFEDNRRVVSQIECLKKNDIAGYLSLVQSSGSSSWRLLQNCYPPGESREQGPALALGLTERFLGGTGACRIHGGGFAGTIQAYIPTSRSRDYSEYIDGIFGAGAALPLSLRERGSIPLL
jgi:galactokinase